jgi:MoxR-like ATPase
LINFQDNAMPRANYHYYGGRKPDKPWPGAHDEAEPYQPDPELVKAVNLAIYLERPLLLEGEAGCGKSRLAYAVAYELGLPLYVWPVRSTSQAHDGLYTYDAILRLHDVQIMKAGDITPERNPRNPREYLSFGQLGEAFQLKDHPAVVLIDEIDKADLDFPNDLLSVLEKPRHFNIPETGEVGADKGITATHPPIVIITSNKEKGNLPAPFLRRCVYYYIRFPDDPAVLKQIVELHLPKRLGRTPSKKTEQALIDKAIALFLDIRRSGMTKAPSTSELLDWMGVLLDFDDGKPYPIDQLPDKVTKILPYPEALYKLRTDWVRLAGGA